MTEKCACGKFVTTGATQCETCKVKSAVDGNKTLEKSAPPKTAKFETPQFIPDNVALWWKQIEARLDLAGITDEETKFKHIAAGLPPEVVSKVSDLIFNPPVEAPYGKIRDRKLKEFEPKDSAKLQSLLEGCQLGDKKPSTLLREMRQLAQGRVTDETLRELYLRRLPSSLSSIFRTTNVTDLDKVAAAADEVKGTNPSQFISAVAASTLSSQVW